MDGIHTRTSRAFPLATEPSVELEASGGAPAPVVGADGTFNGAGLGWDGLGSAIATTRMIKSSLKVVRAQKRPDGSERPRKRASYVDGEVDASARPSCRHRRRSADQPACWLGQNGTSAIPGFCQRTASSGPVSGLCTRSESSRNMVHRERLRFVRQNRNHYTVETSQGRVLFTIYNQRRWIGGGTKLNVWKGKDDEGVATLHNQQVRYEDGTEKIYTEVLFKPPGFHGSVAHHRRRCGWPRLIRAECAGTPTFIMAMMELCIGSRPGIRASYTRVPPLSWIIFIRRADTRPQLVNVNDETALLATWHSNFGHWFRSEVGYIEIEAAALEPGPNRLLDPETGETTPFMQSALIAYLIAAHSDL